MVTTATLTVTPGTAHACSCIDLDLSDYADDITVAFVGTQVEKVVHDYVDDNGAALLFSVDRVYTGEAGPLIEVRTHAQGDPACGIDMDGRGPVGIVAHEWRGALSVDLCGSIVSVVELESVFGEGRPPDESIPPPVSPDASEDFFNTGLTLVLAAAAVATLTGAAIVWRRRR